MFRTPLSPEFRLAAACCVPDAAEANRIVRTAGSIDWDRFAAVVKRNRIEPLVSRHLPSTGLQVPPRIIDSLRSASDSAVANNLRFAAASDQLLHCFQKAGIDPLFVKGLTLSMLAYGSIALKKGWDIDVLVHENQVANAGAVLRELDYECLLPGPSPSDDGLQRWAVYSKESVWHNPDRGVYVELHTRLVDNRMLLPRFEDFGATRLVQISPNIALPTLCEERLFAYLCIHGASSAWFRLKWLADFAALIRAKEPGELEKLYRTSQRLGAGRAAGQALLLCKSLFRTKLSRGMTRELNSTRAHLILQCISLYVLDGGRPEAELDVKRFGTLPIHVAQFLILPGWRFKLSEFGRQAGAFWRRLFFRCR